MTVNQAQSIESRIAMELRMCSEHRLTKKILLEISFSEKMRTTRGNKQVPQTFSTIPLTREDMILWFNPFDFVPSAQGRI